MNRKQKRSIQKILGNYQRVNNEQFSKELFRCGVDNFEVNGDTFIFKNNDEDRAKQILFRMVMERAMGIV